MRSAELLRASEKLAVVGRLASSIAHEISNPLEAVTNLHYLAERSTDLTEVLEYVDQAQKEVIRVSHIATQILRFHRQSTKPGMVCLSEIFDGVTALLVAKDMSETTLRRIFEPFFTTKDLTGTGLGIWVSSRILENYSASLRVRSRESARHHGTVFSIFSPESGVPS